MAGNNDDLLAEFEAEIAELAGEDDEKEEDEKEGKESHQQTHTSQPQDSKSESTSTSTKRVRDESESSSSSPLPYKKVYIAAESPPVHIQNDQNGKSANPSHISNSLYSPAAPYYSSSQPSYTAQSSTLSQKPIFIPSSVSITSLHEVQSNASTLSSPLSNNINNSTSISSTSSSNTGISNQHVDNQKSALKAARKAAKVAKKEAAALRASTLRGAAGDVWVDPTMASYPPNDFRIFVGDLGIEVNDQMLSKFFSHYSSFALARVVRDKKNQKSKGYGFASFIDHEEGARALKEMTGKYCGNRPIRLKRSEWHKRSLEAYKERTTKK